jgi:hypothetical protein
MGSLRRLARFVGVLVSLAAALAVASVWAAGGFGQGPGRFTFNDTAAFADFFSPRDQSSENVSVDRSLFTFRARADGAFQTQMMTVLTVSVFVPNPDPTQPPLVADFGCFVIPDTDFVVSNDLQSATLNATVDRSNFCPGFLVPVTGALPNKGGGGGGGGFTFPLTVTASWTGTGVNSTQEDQGTFRCDSFLAGHHGRTTSAMSSSVTVTISGIGTFSGGLNSFGNVSVSSNAFDVAGTGILPPACGGGKGG